VFGVLTGLAVLSVGARPLFVNWPKGEVFSFVVVANAYPIIENVNGPVVGSADVGGSRKRFFFHILLTNDVTVRQSVVYEFERAA
jgi:hypothetical protein